MVTITTVQAVGDVCSVAAEVRYAFSMSYSRDNSGQLPRRRSKQEVCDLFLARLQERGDIDISTPGFIESICQHFERLPTRYALDVNTDSLDVLSHKRLLDEARLDPTTVSFAVRPVEVLHTRPRESSDVLPSPAFHEVGLPCPFPQKQQYCHMPHQRPLCSPLRDALSWLHLGDSNCRSQHLDLHLTSR